MFGNRVEDLVIGMVVNIEVQLSGRFECVAQLLILRQYQTQLITVIGEDRPFETVPVAVFRAVRPRQGGAARTPEQTGDVPKEVCHSPATYLSSW